MEKNLELNEKHKAEERDVRPGLKMLIGERVYLVQKLKSEIEALIGELAKEEKRFQQSASTAN